MSAGLGYLKGILRVYVDIPLCDGSGELDEELLSLQWYSEGLQFRANFASVRTDANICLGKAGSRADPFFTALDFAPLYSKFLRLIKLSRQRS